MCYCIAPSDWRHDRPNPFGGGLFGEAWAGLFLEDTDDYIYLPRTYANGLYCIRFGKRTADLEHRIADFIRYHHALSRSVIVGSAVAVEIHAQVERSLCQTPLPELAREYDPHVVVHSTTIDRWRSIQLSGQLLPSRDLQRAGTAYPRIGFEALGEPAEYDTFVYFSTLGNEISETVVHSHQEGRIVIEPDSPYQPGARLYLDCDRMFQRGIILRDGFHMRKARGALSLAEYLIDVVIPADCASLKQSDHWTPRNYYRAADEVFSSRNPDR